MQAQREFATKADASLFAIDSVASRDGTQIGYREYGNGRGVALVSGAMGTAQNYDTLAMLLARRFRVVVPDRRGRGVSPKVFTRRHCIERDLEDLDAVMTKAGCELVFGLSSGAVIALEAARTLSAVKAVALYEPPFYLDTEMRFDLVTRFNKQVERGELARALVTLGRIVRLAPPIAAWIPDFLATEAARIALAGERPGAYASLAALLPATRYDLKVVSEMQGSLAAYASLQTDVLLLGGTKSPAYLKTALAYLNGHLSRAKRVELDGLDHSGPWNSDTGGQPALVAQALISFFDAGI